MPGPLDERELSVLYQSTLEAIVPGLQNAIFKPTPYLDYVQMLKTTEFIGERIRVPIEYDKNNSFQYYKDLGQLETTPQKNVRSAYYDWATWVIGVMVSEREEKVQNNGKKAIYNLITNRITSAVRAASEQLDFDFMQSTGEPTQAGITPSNGLYTLVGDHLSDITYVGELSAVDNVWWRSRIHRTGDGNNPGADLPVAGEGQVLTMFGVDKMIDDLDEDGMKPDMAFLRSDIKRALIAVLAQNDQPVMSDKDYTLRTGFDNIVYRGVTFAVTKQIKTYPITGRLDVASDIFWLPKSDALALSVYPDSWFTQTDWREPVNQLARIAWIKGMGNLIAKNRRWLGKTERVARQA